MTSGWDNYYVLLLAALLSLGIPFALGVLSRIARPKVIEPGPSRSEELGAFESLEEVRRKEKIQVTEIGQRFNVRFLFGSSALLILIAVCLVMVPFSGLITRVQDRAVARHAFVFLLSVMLLTSLGVAYVVRKGDTRWLRAYTGGGREQ